MRYLIVLLLAGCAMSDMVKVAEPRAVVIEWVREKPTNCGDTARAEGCAYSTKDYSRCKLYALETATDAVLGHELRHCFGYEHETDLKRQRSKP